MYFFQSKFIYKTVKYRKSEILLDLKQICDKTNKNQMNTHYFKNYYGLLIL